MGGGIYEFNDFIKLLDIQKAVVLKHTHSSVGQGFHLIETTDKDGTYLIDRQPADISRLKVLVMSLDQYLVQEYITQHPYSDEIYSGSVNTIRFQCVWDYETKTFFVARSFHRFGCNGQIVDNVGAGNGILLYINPDTGELLNEGVIKMNGIKRYFKNASQDFCHPDSGIKLNGVKIPGYCDVRDEIVRISNEHAYLRWIGWDVVITEDGFKIIEANSLTTLETIQQREGFLKDKRIRKVLKK